MVARLLKDWAALTFRADTTKLGPLRISHWNWLIVAAAAVTAYVLPGQRLQAAAVIGIWLIMTLTRAAYFMPRRRAALVKLYDLLQAKAFLPPGTVTRPIAPESHVTGVKWGKRLAPAAFTLVTGAKCPSASSTILRPVLEGAIEDLIENPLAAEGGDWVFAWDPKARTIVSCVAVAGDHPGLMKKTIERRIIRALRDASAFNLTVAVSVQDNYSLAIEEWAEETKSDGETVPFPTSMTFRTGSRDLTDVGFRDTIERGFDRLVPCPGEWLYGWDVEGGSLRITRVAKSSLEARRKLHERKFADDVRSAVTKLGKDPIVAAVTGWAADDSDQPQTITVHFGTLQLGERRMRDRFEDSLDNSVQSRWPDLRLLFDWQLGGGATTLDIFGVDHKDQRAQRKAVEKKLRNVVESKFGKARSPVDCDILEWQDSDGTTNAALPKIARVSFGAIDVNKAETRDDFQEHWDSLVVENDWHYHWDSAEGTVTIAAVEKLATAIAFPEVGTPEFEDIVEHFRAGRIYIGPQKGGGVFYWNLNKVAHGLVGGRTGAGKSVFLDIALFLTLWCRDTADIIVCDPKRTDFTWTPEFPNVVRFAAGVVEIVEAIQFVHDEMERRQSLLNRRGVRNLGYLRTLYEAHPEFEAEDGPAPKRLILFFDELSNFSGQSANEDIEALKTVARTQLEGLGQLARALEINMIVAAQKPEAKYVSTQLKEMMEFRLCVGPVNEYTSKQILETNHGTRFPESGTPKGRAWATTSEIGFKVVQIPYLPNATEPCPWDPSITLTGSRERLRTQLAAAGYGTRTRTNKDGGTDTFWVPVEGAPDRQTGAEAAVVPTEVPAEGKAIAEALAASAPFDRQTRSLRIVKQPERQPDSAPGEIFDLDAEPDVGEDDPWAV